MKILVRLKKRLEQLVFIELKEGAQIGTYKLPNAIYVAIRSDELINKVKGGDSMEHIPLSILYEGMFFVLGADEDFRFNDDYRKLLKANDDSIKFIKSKIFNLVKEEKFEDAFIFLMGLSKVEETKEVYEKLIVVTDKLRNEEEDYTEIEMKILNRAKGFGGFPLPHLYDALIKRDQGDFIFAMEALQKYLELGGKEDNDIIEFKQNLSAILSYDKGKELSITDPKASLEILIPLMSVLGDSAEYYYHIAVAYRNLENYEKAIYYLNEAFSIDKRLLEVYNEFGINYAALGDYDKAIQYFEKAFEQSKSIELATNIVMCYIHNNNMKKAKEALEEAIKIDPNDDIVQQLREYYKI
ncbi:tetratricopeptide repeat protein [Oceanirhabdus sp. W0125-5]|uniref:tetratricopeptide repeat protein n=1 Tax=Oceanirhabdus sp. W0125-5 TaxID=2999116 RepID=UPI0022F32A0C|nr:tetratricopeptide repeat protein [Oceanirhabdus sp. W0125-5]WBW99430.1 tetratricopeptide repeat protein [Oceanirhabdus sp. W0125-5]